MKKIALALATLAFLLATSCGGDTNCKNACDKVSSCGLKSSGLSCDANCSQGDCAACVEDKTCGEIAGGSCANACPGVSFVKK